MPVILASSASVPSGRGPRRKSGRRRGTSAHADRAPANFTTSAPIRQGYGIDCETCETIRDGLKAAREAELTDVDFKFREAVPPRPNEQQYARITSYGDRVTQSWWLKWARAVEHQRALARATREFLSQHTYEYERVDNAGDRDDPLVKIHWQLRIKRPFPEHWSPQLGDILTNLRGALDHLFWEVVTRHSGPPTKPTRVQFPIETTSQGFASRAGELRQLVSPEVWQVVDALQPFHGGAQAYASPLAILAWLNNLDKHRAVHVIGRTFVDLGPTVVDANRPLEIVENWRAEGSVEDGAVVARCLKIRRPTARQFVDLRPTPAFVLSLPIRDNPTEYRSIASLVPKMNEKVLEALVYVSKVAGMAMPDVNKLVLGAEHDDVAAEYGGGVVFVSSEDGEPHAVPLRSITDET
jgi:hypothetical protein